MQSAKSSETQVMPASLKAESKSGSGDPARRARENLVLVLMNHNDFVTVR